METSTSASSRLGRDVVDREHLDLRPARVAEHAPARSPRRAPGRGPRAWRASCRARRAPAGPTPRSRPRPGPPPVRAAASSCSPSSISAPVTSVLRPCRRPSSSRTTVLQTRGQPDPVVLAVEQREHLALERHRQRQAAPLGGVQACDELRRARRCAPARRRTATRPGPATRRRPGGSPVRASGRPGHRARRTSSPGSRQHRSDWVAQYSSSSALYSRNSASVLANLVSPVARLTVT